MAPDLARLSAAGSPDRQVDVIIRYKVQPRNRHRQMVERAGGKLKRHLELLQSAVYSARSSRLEELANNPDVEYISPDRAVKGTLDYAEPTVNANLALALGSNGSGVTVAVIDSGIMDSHPDLQDSKAVSRVVYAQDFNPTVVDYFDGYGHGTHVAGIIGGDASMSTGLNYTHKFIGIAPNVTYVTYTVQYDIFTVGAGYLDVMAALNNTDKISATKMATSPAVTFNSANKKVAMVTGDQCGLGRQRGLGRQHVGSGDQQDRDLRRELGARATVTGEHTCAQ